MSAYKILTIVVFIILFGWSFIIFELAVDSNNISVANQKTIDSLENRITQIEKIQQTKDTIVINNYVQVKQ